MSVKCKCGNNGCTGKVWFEENGSNVLLWFQNNKHVGGSIYLDADALVVIIEEARRALLGLTQ